MTIIFERLPLEIVKYILLYDNRFVIREGNIIIINKLNVNKYSNIIYLLSIKPKVQHYITQFIGRSGWITYCITFRNNVGIHYNIKDVGATNKILYTFGENIDNDFIPHNYLQFL